MIELKTLKDIKLSGSTMSIAENYAKLQEEAIKWIKTFEFGTPSGLHPLSQKTISWIKHFFNITKKDLK